MKKKFVLILFLLFAFMCNLKAVSIMMEPNEIAPKSYVIGTHLFLRDNLNAIYDGKLTTQRIMLAAHTIDSDDQYDQLVYYKKMDGTWINALTGVEITLPEGKIEITKINLIDPEVESASSQFLAGSLFAQKIRALANSNDEVNTNIVSIRRADELPSITISDDNLLSISTEGTPIYGWFDEGTIYYYTEAETLYLNEDSSYMFSNLENLEYIDLSALYFQKAENLEGLFKNCKNLESLSFYDVNTVNVTNMSYMFAGCRDLAYISMNGFASDHLLNMSHMFDGCESITDIFISMDTSNVTDMSYMFKDCTSLKELDLSNLDLSKANVTGLLEGDINLTTLRTPMVNSNQTIVLPRELYDKEMIKYEELTSATKTEEELVAIATFVSGQQFNAKIKSLAKNGSASYTDADSRIYYIERASKLPEGIVLANTVVVSPSTSSNPIYIWFDSTNDEKVLYYYSEAIRLYLSGDSSYMFYNLHEVNYIDLSDIDTSNVTNMAFMFANCENLTSAEVGSFDTLNVTNMQAMFYNCASLSSISTGNFDTSNVTNMANMFAYCTNLNSLYLSNFDTLNVTNMQAMFYNCSSLSELDVSSFDTRNVINMDNMFNGCKSISSLDLSELNLSAIVSANNIFDNMDSLNELYTPATNSSKKIFLMSVMKDSSNNIYGVLSSTTPTSTRLTALTTLENGQEFNIKIKTLAGNEDVTRDTVDNNITSIVRAGSIPSGMTFTNENILSTANSPKTVYGWYDNGTIYYYSEETNIYLNANSNYMFAKLNALANIDLSEFNFSPVDSANYMLSSTPALAEIVTPSVNPQISIALPKTMYFQSNSNGIDAITSTTATEAILKSMTW